MTLTVNEEIVCNLFIYYGKGITPTSSKTGNPRIVVIYIHVNKIYTSYYYFNLGNLLQLLA